MLLEKAHTLTDDEAEHQAAENWNGKCQNIDDCHLIINVIQVVGIQQLHLDVLEELATCDQQNANQNVMKTALFTQFYAQ